MSGCRANTEHPIFGPERFDTKPRDILLKKPKINPENGIKSRYNMNICCLIII